MYKYFIPGELKCRCGVCKSNGTEMDIGFMTALEELREMCKFPFVLTSAFRCPSHNNTVSTTGYKGPHTTGKAVDISADGKQAFILLENIFKQGAFKRIGINRKKGSGFIHVDSLTAEEGFPIEIVWTY